MYRRSLTAAPSGNTFTLVQAGQTTNCFSTSPCTLTHGAVTAGNLAIIWAGSQDGGTKVMTGVSGGGTWTVPSSGAGSCSTGSGLGISCAYILSASSATANSIQITTTAGANYTAQLWEFSYTPGSISLDAQNSTFNSSSATTQTGQALTLTGTSDLIIQYEVDSSAGSAVTGISGSYTNRTDFAVTSAAIKLNTNVGTAPTWSFSSSVINNVGALAFK